MLQNPPNQLKIKSSDGVSEGVNKSVRNEYNNYFKSPR